jgi:hypothetical protein
MEKPDPRIFHYALDRLSVGNDLAAAEEQTKAPPGAQAAREELYGQGNRWAILVGVNTYDDEANFGKLRACVKDVEAIVWCVMGEEGVCLSS